MTSFYELLYEQSLCLCRHVLEFIGSDFDFDFGLNFLTFIYIEICFYSFLVYRLA